MQLAIRRIHTFVETHFSELDRIADPPLRKVAIAAIVGNPYAGRYVEDLQPMVDASRELGALIAKLAVEALSPYRAQSYGKGAVVGLAGDREHANALITTTFATPLREALNGGRAWISSFTKRAAPDTPIDIPLAHKDALYVRSHYDGMTVTVPDSPQADEIIVIVALANRGRLNARVGGLSHDEIKGENGLN